MRGNVAFHEDVRSANGRPGRWRFLASAPMAGADNMAVDEALLTRARRTGETVLRVYAWSTPTLSLGRHQRAIGVFDPARAGALGIGIVRRITGGRALLHHREVTYSVTAPVLGDATLRDSYGAINLILLRALHLLGVPARLAEPRGRTPLPESAPCFERPAAGEIVLGDRKLVGSAQLRDGGALLQHGSILIDDDQSLISRVASRPVGDPAPAATLRAALGRVPVLGDVAAALFQAVRELEDPCAVTLGDAAGDIETDRALAFARYASDAWTWRR